MARANRLTFLVIGALIIGTFFLASTESGRENIRVPSLFNGSSKSSNSSSSDREEAVQEYQRENATFVTLARNDELGKLLVTLQSFEDRFNHQFHYDWVFLNNGNFTDEFIESVSNVVSGTAKFGIIPPEHWGYPEWIDQSKADKAMKKMKEDRVMYGDKVNYHHMCRFESGFFYKHEIMQQYKYYWRVEPQTGLLCEVNYDLFKFMREKGKRYGWTMSMKEFRNTIPTLYKTTQKFINENPELVDPQALTKFVHDDEKNDYNLCHFWTNFEIADADFWRNQTYEKYFNYLDKEGGFFYERWGDAPVHSLALAYFMPRDEIHFFEDVAYFHHPFKRCPANSIQRGMKCACRQKESYDWHKSSCLRVYYDARGERYPDDYREPFEHFE